MQPKVFPLSCDPPVHHIHVIAGTQELEAFQHTLTSHGFSSPSKTLPGQWFWSRDFTPVPSVRSASADCKKAAHVKCGEAEGKSDAVYINSDGERKVNWF